MNISEYFRKTLGEFISISGMIGLFSLLFTMIYGKSGWFITIFVLLAILIFQIIYRFPISENIFPYSLMLLSPSLLIHYSTVSDFNLRLIIFISLIYIFTFTISKPAKEINLTNIFKKPIMVWITPFIIFSLLSVVLYIKGIHLSGDEPHYLMVTQSLVDDYDFNLKNNVEEKTYMNFIPVELRAHMIIKNGKHLSYHMPGMSFLMTPFYMIFKNIPFKIPPQLFFRISASFINAFFSFLLFYLLKFLFPEKNTEEFWLLSLFMFPVIFHSVHLYPELPAATLLIGSLLLSQSKFDKPVIAGFLYSVSIWFHVKYYPALFLFAVFILIGYLKDKDYKKIFYFFLLPVISTLLLILYCKLLYNTLNPANIFPPENYFATPILLKIKVFLSYFFDQRDGLIIYSPVLFLFLFGFKNRFKRKNILISLLMIYVIFHSITTVRGAYSPAGRPVIFVLWIIVILTANYYLNIKNRLLFKTLAGISLLITLLLTLNPILIYQPVYSSTTFRWSGMLKFLGSDIIDIPKFFPSFLTNSSVIYLPNPIWLIFIVIILTLFYTHKQFPIKPDKKNIIVLLFVIFYFILCFYPHLYLTKESLYVKDGVRFFCSSRNFVYIQNKDAYRIKTGTYYNLYFDIKSRRKKIKMVFESKLPAEIHLTNSGKSIVSKHQPELSEIKIDLGSLRSFKFKNRDLVNIGFILNSGNKTRFPLLKIGKAN